jgi:hypothetical protein
MPYHPEILNHVTVSVCHAHEQSNSVNTVCGVTCVTGADPNARNSEGHTVLHMAAASHHQPDIQLQLVQLLLQYKASATIQDEQGNTALHFAAPNSTPDVLQLLLSRSPEVCTPNRAGQTALDISAKHGRVVSCQRLLARSAGKDGRGLGALVAAAESGQARVVQLLLAHGVVPAPYRFASALAEAENEPSMVHLWLHPEPGLIPSEFALGAAAAKDHPRIVQLLLERGVAINEFALAAAAAKNHTTVLSLLLAALPEASVKAAARIAAPAAAYAGHVATLELLLPHAGYGAFKQEEMRAAARCCCIPGA